MEAISQLAGSSHDSRVAMTSDARQAMVALEDARRRPTSGDEEDAAYLRNFYGKTQSRDMKVQIISAVARMGGTTNDQWVLAIAKNGDEDMRLRREALSRLRSPTLTVDDLGKLFDSLSERELRTPAATVARRDEPAAPQAIEIAKSGTVPRSTERSPRWPARKTPYHQAVARCGKAMSPVTRGFGGALAAAMVVAVALGAQGGLRARVEGSGDARVQFRYAARADVCGAGSAIQIGTSHFINSGNWRWDGADRSLCKRGPVVVRVTRSGGMVVGIDVEIAPESHAGRG